MITFLIMMMMIRRSIGRLPEPPNRPHRPRLLHAWQTGHTMTLIMIMMMVAMMMTMRKRLNILLLQDMYGPAAVYSYEPTPSPG